MGAERCDERAPVLGSGHRDVESSFAAFHQERSEAVWEVAALVLAITDREDDRVALVALDALEVLDEETLLARLVEELADLRLELRVGVQALAQTFLDPVGMLDTH